MTHVWSGGCVSGGSCAGYLYEGCEMTRVWTGGCVSGGARRERLASPSWRTVPTFTTTLWTLDPCR